MGNKEYSKVQPFLLGLETQCRSDYFFKCSHPSSSSPISETQLSDPCEIRKDFSPLEVCNHRGDVASLGLSNKNNIAYSNVYQLQQEVERLEQDLQEELELHAILENAIQQNAVELSTSLCLPRHAQDLLSNIAILESTVSKLEQEFISLHFQLSQERNERRLAEYRWRNSYSQLLFISSDEKKAQVRDQPSKAESSSCIYQTIENAEKNISVKMDTEYCHHVDVGKLTRELQHKDFCCYPNQLSEEMVRCMKNIFITLADSIMPSKSSTPGSHCSSLSPSGHLSNLSMWSLSDRSMISSWVQSPKIDLQSNTDVLAMENTYDPYRMSGKLSWADIGSYRLATEVSWMSVGEKQLEHAAEALRGFRTLVDQLAKVNPIHLSCNEKLAFWINIYNALIMHAYLAYGVPKSDLKLFSLMQKAAYTIGGHSFSAAAIEYVILKMKPPVHRPQIALLLALHKLKVSNEQRDCSIDKCEPLVAFALSCGMYSSPAVRIYSAQNVREELQEAQLDFIRASVGVSRKGKLLVPKMLHCFAKSLVDDTKLAVWMAHFLPPNQAAFVEKCISKRRGLLGSCNCGILPFDSRFRYLFLTEKISV